MNKDIIIVLASALVTFVITVLILRKLIQKFLKYQFFKNKKNTVI